MPRLARWLIRTVVTVSFAGASLCAQGPSPTAIEQLLRAHKAWDHAPNSIEINGASTIGNTTKPIKITATRLEEVLTERDTKKQIATAAKSFKDDGTKLQYDPTPSGFAQLDVTGVFFLAQLGDRTLTVGASKSAQIPQGPGQAVHVSGNRSQFHYGRIQVRDQFDLYVGADGLLAGISRSFYENDPRIRFTIAYAFSDYRETGGVLLPYRIETYLKGSKVETIVVDSYHLDVPASSSLFTPRSVR
jgi:hypothetical protein